MPHSLIHIIRGWLLSGGVCCEWFENETSFVFNNVMFGALP